MSTSPHGAKGYDDSPPRNGVIFFYTVLTVFALLGVKLLLDSYFVKTMESEIHDKVLTRGMEEVTALRAAERAELPTDKSSLKALSAQLKARPRSTATPPAAPEVKGWTQLGREPALVPMPPDALAPAPGTNPDEPKPASSVNPAGRAH